MPQAKIKENSCGRVCASLRDRNAFHLDMSQEQVYPTIYRKKQNPGGAMEHPDLAPA
jgi:hypothetical protein